MTKQIAIERFIRRNYQFIIDDYTKFKLLIGINRQIKPSHVATMRKSVKETMVIRPIVVAKLSFMPDKICWYIIDGQHLFEALCYLNLPIPIVEIIINTPIELIERLALINNSSKKWDTAQYVNAWKNIKPVYGVLEEKRAKTGLPYVSITALAMNIPSRSGIAKKIKEGEFDIINENFEFLLTEAVELLDIKELKKTAKLPDRFVIAFLGYYNSVKKYNSKLVRERIIANYKRIIVGTAEEMDVKIRQFIFND